MCGVLNRVIFLPPFVLRLRAILIPVNEALGGITGAWLSLIFLFYVNLGANREVMGRMTALN